MNKICKNCVTDSTFPNFELDEFGVCNYCKMHEKLESAFPNKKIGSKIINQRVNKIKLRNKKNKYDVVIGVSGGRDSTFLLYYAKIILNLRVLAVHFNDGFGNPVAGENIYKVTKQLNIDLKIYTSDWRLSKDLKISFLKANVPDIETPTDVGIASALFAAAHENNIKDILIGQSFRTEGISPLDWNFLDGKYVESIQKKFGKVNFTKWDPNKINFNLKLHHIFYYTMIKNIRVFCPFYHYDYDRNDVTKIIIEKLSWTDTGAHYFDDLYQSLLFKWLKEKFNIDRRKFNYSALIRSNQLTREIALEKLSKDFIDNNDEIVNLCLKRLGVHQSFFNELISNNKIKFFRDYNTSYSVIKISKILIYLASKLNLIPSTTYDKYFKF